MVQKVERVNDEVDGVEEFMEHIVYKEVPPEIETSVRKKLDDIEKHLDSQIPAEQYSEIVDEVLGIAEPYWKQTVYTAMPPDVMEEDLIPEFAYEAHHYLENKGLSRQNSARIISSIVRDDFKINL